MDYHTYLVNMGHQTYYKKCNKCNGLIIWTFAFGKKIVTSNCKCN